MSAQNADLVTLAQEAAKTALLREYGGFNEPGRVFNAERIAKVVAGPVVEAVIKASPIRQERGMTINADYVGCPDCGKPCPRDEKMAWLSEKWHYCADCSMSFVPSPNGSSEAT